MRKVIQIAMASAAAALILDGLARAARILRLAWMARRMM